MTVHAGGSLFITGLREFSLRDPVGLSEAYGANGASYGALALDVNGNPWTPGDYYLLSYSGAQFKGIGQADQAWLNSLPYWQADLSATADGSTLFNATEKDKNLYIKGNQQTYAPGVINADRIFVSAVYLNLDGLLVAGHNAYDITLGGPSSGLPINTTQEIEDLIAAKANGGQQTGLVKLSASNPDATVYWDLDNSRIWVNDIRVSGGFINVDATVVNTGGGEIRTFGGYGSIAIDNQTGYAMVVNNLDDSALGGGTVIITDHGRADASGNPYVTIYQETSTGIHITEGAGNVITQSDSTNLFQQYNPAAGARWDWSYFAKVGFTETAEKKSDTLFYFADFKDSYSGPYTIGSLLLAPTVLDSLTYADIQPGNTNTSDQYYVGKYVLYDSGNVKTKDHTDDYFFVQYHTLDFQRTIIENLYYNHSIPAWYPINVTFPGNFSGGVMVTSNATVYLNGVINNPHGDTTIDTTSGYGSILSLNGTELVGGNRVNLLANSVIGTATAPIHTNVSNNQGGKETVLDSYLHVESRVSLLGNGVYIDQPKGVLPIDVIRADELGTISITAPDGMRVASYYTGVMSPGLIEGGAITLTSSAGSIGSAAQPLTLDYDRLWLFGGQLTETTGDQLNVTALGDVGLVQKSGDLYLNSVAASGDVTISVPAGNVIDVNPNVQTDTRTAQQLLDTVGADLQLTADKGYAQNVADTLAAYTTARQQEYFTYWQFRHRQADGGAAYDASFVVTLSDTELAYVRDTLHYTADEITTLVNTRTAEYHTLNATYGGLGAFNAAFTYVPTQAEIDAVKGSIHLWTANELLTKFGSGLIKDVTNTVVVVKAPNIVGRSINVTTAGSIGTTAAARVIDVASVPLTISDADKITLAAAERPDVQYLAAAPITTSALFDAASQTITRTDGGDWIAGGLKAGMQLAVESGDGSVLHSATGSTVFYKVLAVTQTTITVDGNVLPVGNETANNAVFLAIVPDPTFAATGVTTTAPVVFKPSSFATAGSIARTDGGSFVADGFVAGELLRVQGSAGNTSPAITSYTIAAVTDGVITLIASDPLVAETDPLGVTLIAGVIPSITTVRVAQNAPITVTSTGQLDATAGSFILINSAQSLTLDHVAAGNDGTGADIRIKDTSSLLGTANTAGNIRGRFVVLEAATGGVGSEATPVTVVSPVIDGTVTVRAQDSVYLRGLRVGNTSGDLAIETVYSAAGDVSLQAVGSIFDALDTEFTKIKGRDIVLSAAQGVIGGPGNHGTNYIDIEASGSVTAHAFSDIDLSQTIGNMRVNWIASVIGNIDLRASGSILRAAAPGTGAPNPEQPGADISGRSVTLTSRTGGIGTADNPLETFAGANAPDSATLSASSKLLNIYLLQVFGDVRLGSISTGAGQTAFVTATEGSIFNGAAPGTENVLSGITQLFARDNIGTAASHISTQVGLIEAQSTTGSTFIDNLGGLTVGNALTAAAQGLKAAGTVLISASSPVTLNKSIQAGGDILVVAKDDGKKPDPGDKSVIGDSIVVSATDLSGKPLVLQASGTIRLLAGADVILPSGATLQANAVDIEGDWQGDLNGNLTGQANIYPGIASHIVLAGTIKAPSISVNGGVNQDLITVTGTLDAGPGGSIAIFTGNGTGSIDLWGTVSANSTTLTAGFSGNAINVNAANTQGNSLDLTGTLNIVGGAGDDTILLNRLATLDPAEKYRGTANAGDLVTGLEQIPQRFEVNVDTNGGNDTVTVNTTGTSDDIVNIHNSGQPGQGVARLVINGTGQGDTMLLRDQSVILLQPDGQGGFGPGYERINYDSSIGLLQINEPGGDNHFYVDGNGAITQIDAGDGNNTYQFGQLFGTDRTPGIDIGSGETIPTIQTDQGTVSRGIRYATSILAGAGHDTVTVYASAAPLTVFGGSGTENVVVRPFVNAATTGPSANTLTVSDVVINGGSGALQAELGIGAPVTLNGGSGTTSVTVLGTSGNDTIVVTKDGVFGAGRSIRMSNVSALSIDGLDGNDQFDVQSVAAGTTVTLIGGGGSDTFNVGGDVTQKITARQANGQTAYVNYGVTSDDPAYSGLVVSGTALQVATPQTSTVLVRQPGGPAMLVKGGANGTDTASYTLQLTVPAPDLPSDVPVVAVTVSASQLPASLTRKGGQSVLVSTDGVHFAQSVVVTFDATAGSATPWERVQTLYVKAPADTLADGTQSFVINQSIRSNVASLNGQYIAGVAGVVTDPNTPGSVTPPAAPPAPTGAGVLVTPVGTNTVATAANPISETIQLTQAPTAPVFVQLMSDGNSFFAANADTLQPERFQVGVLGQGPSIRFDASNWNVPFTVDIGAAQTSGFTTGMPVVVQPFGAGPHDVSAIQGHVIIQGGANPSSDYALHPAVMLPSETDTPPAVLNAAAFNATQNVTVNVFNDASTRNDVGTLGAVGDIGTIAGLGMGAGSIVYRGVQTVDVLLGTGDDSFTVHGTTPGAVTVVQGGGGSNHLIADGGGGATSPLVLLGSTTQNGAFYAAPTGLVNVPVLGAGREFTNVGNNIIDARLDPSSVVIGGGAGDDTIYGGGGGDWIAGGSGNNTIFGGSGADIILGADGFNLDLSHSLAATASITYQGGPILSVANSGQGFDDPVTGDRLVAGANTITGGAGDSIIFGTHGFITQDGSINRITSTGGVSGAQTVLPGDGMANVISASDGNNVVFGGQAADTITLGAGRNVVIGDLGLVNFVNGAVSYAGSFAGAAGGNTITAGNGRNVVIAGAGADTVTLGDGANIVLGDEGSVGFAAGVMVSAQSLDPAEGGDDRITFGAGNNILIGGNGIDTIRGGDGNNTLLGDNGIVTDDATGALFQIRATDPQYGSDNRFILGNGSNIVIGGNGGNTIVTGDGANLIAAGRAELDETAGVLTGFGTADPTYPNGNTTITAGDGNNVIIGGTGADTIKAGKGRNIVLGDDGSLSYAGGVLTGIQTQDPGLGMADSITLGNGDDIVFGGIGSDTVSVGDGHDIVVGGQGLVNFDAQGRPTLVQATNADNSGNDQITVGAGDSVIMGGAGAGTITAGDGRDIVFGNDGAVTYASGVLVSAASVDPAAGGAATITLGGGDNLVFGGAGAAGITVGDGSNVILGHVGEVDFTDGVISLAVTNNPDVGSNATILAGNGHNFILAAGAAGTITAGNGGNVIAGASVEMRFTEGRLASVTTSDPSYVASETITTGSGDDVIIGGGGGANTIDAGSGTNLVIGHQGIVEFSGGVVSTAQSTGPLFAAASAITAGQGNDVIIAGPGMVTVAVGQGNHVILADSGTVSFDAHGVPVHVDSQSPYFLGAKTITTGDGNNDIFQASLSDSITTGAGTQLVLAPGTSQDLNAGGVFWQAAASAPSARTAVPLGAATLAQVVVQAEQIWQTVLGSDSVAPASLAQVHVALGSLPQGMLGLTDGDTIVIDATAAGWGWETDTAAAVPADRMDLLSTVLHELGNAMGFAEDQGQDVMGAALQPGTRTLPETVPALRADAATAQPRIDWSRGAGLGGSPAAPTLATTGATAGWLDDFVFNGAKGPVQYGPNAGFRVTIPIVDRPMNG